MSDSPPNSPPEDVSRLVRERADAREAGRFPEADSLRDQIRELGWEVMDGPHGTTVRPVLPSASEAEVGSLLDEPPSREASLVVVAEDHPADLGRFLRGLG